MLWFAAVVLSHWQHSVRLQVAAKSNKAVSASLTFCVIDGEALFDCSVDETSDVSADAARSL